MRYDDAARRQAVRKGRERGCSVYIPVEFANGRVVPGLLDALAGGFVQMYLILKASA